MYASNSSPIVVVPSSPASLPFPLLKLFGKCPLIASSERFPCVQFVPFPRAEMRLRTFERSDDAEDEGVVSASESWFGAPGSGTAIVAGSL